MAKKPNSRAEGPLGKIVVAVVIALLAGGSAPWWWSRVFTATAACPSQELKDELFRAGPDKSAVIKARARTLREELERQHYDCVSDLASLLLEHAQDNGHGLYFSGEAWRGKAKTIAQDAEVARGRMRDKFFRYLDNEPSQPMEDRGGKAEACYQREHGYCAERTAWINHLMAIDYYQQAQAAVDRDIRIQLLQRALGFVNNDLKFGGFDQDIPSPTLKDRIQGELRSLNHRSGGSPRKSTLAADFRSGVA
jgi:hypothetical protein